MTVPGEPAVNDSKGCGGVMRVAPVGIFAARLRERVQTAEMTFDLGRQLAALTLGHPPAPSRRVHFGEGSPVKGHLAREEVERITECYRGSCTFRNRNGRPAHPTRESERGSDR